MGKETTNDKRRGERERKQDCQQLVGSEFARILVKLLVGDVLALLTLIEEFVELCEGWTLRGLDRPTVEHEGVDGLRTLWRRLQAAMPVLYEV